MNCQTPIQSLFLIATLLFSQLSSAFALSPIMQNPTQNQMQDCHMEKTHSAKKPVHTAAIDMRNMAEHDSATEHHDSNTHMEMDCCDESASTTCCDGECQCSSVIASALFINQILNSQLDTHINKPAEYYTSAPPKPYLHLLHRPPIHTFS